MPFAVACPEIADRVVTVRGVSKTFAMTGWRIGYATGPADVIGAMTRFQGHSTSNPTAIAQAAAVAALTGPMEPIWQMREAFDGRRTMMLDLLEAIDGFSVFPPTGAFYCFPDIGPCLNDRTGKTPLEFADRRGAGPGRGLRRPDERPALVRLLGQGHSGRLRAAAEVRPRVAAEAQKRRRLAARLHDAPRTSEAEELKRSRRARGGPRRAPTAIKPWPRTRPERVEMGLPPTATLRIRAS